LFLFDFIKTIAAVSTFFSTIGIDIRRLVFVMSLNIKQLEVPAQKVHTQIDTNAGKALLFFWLKPLRRRTCGLHLLEAAGS